MNADGDRVGRPSRLKRPSRQDEAVKCDRETARRVRAVAGAEGIEFAAAVSLACERWVTSVLAERGLALVEEAGQAPSRRVD